MKWLVLIVALSGCATPGLATVRWDAGRPVLSPARAAPGARGGVLVVKTAPDVPRDEHHAGRGFAVFDREGRLVRDVPASSGHERIELRPGRYVVVALVDEGLVARSLGHFQVEVASERETLVDAR